MLVRRLLFFWFLFLVSAAGLEPLRWSGLPDVPGDLGVAGPFVGLHGDHLLVAGGANFPEPVWENAKVWRDEVYTLDLTACSASVESSSGWQARA